MGDINACGPRVFQVNGVDTALDPTNSFAIQPAAVNGPQTFLLTMGILNYPSISPMTATIIINVVDQCLSTVIDPIT